MLTRGQKPKPGAGVSGKDEVLSAAVKCGLSLLSDTPIYSLHGPGIGRVVLQTLEPNASDFAHPFLPGSK